MAILGSLNPLNGVIWVGSLHQKRTKTIIEVKVSKIFRLRMELHHEVAPEEQQQNAKIQPLWVPTTPAKPAPAPIPFDLGNGQEYRVSTNPICPETKRMATRTSGGLSQESATQDGLSTGGHKSRPSTLTYDTAEQGWRLTPGTKPTELNDMEAVRSNPFLKLLLQSQIGDGQSSSVRPNQILPTNPILSTEITASVGVVDAMPSTPARETMEKNKNMQECLDHEVTNLVPESNRGKTLMNLCFSGDMVSTNYKSVVSSSSPDFAIPSHILPSIGEENEARAVILTEEDVQPLSVEKPDVANQGIDLNRTPQQKVKRKKHRPKVIREGKPVRTPKPKTPKPVTPKVAMLSKESTIGKRKYVRKKIGQSSSSADSKVLVERSDTDNKNSRSVRRRLDFNLEAVEVRYACPETFMESMHSTQSQTLALHLQRSINGSSTMTTIQHAGVAENPRPGMPFYLNGSATQVPNEYIRSSEVQNPSPKPCAEKLITNEITFHSESIPTNFGTQSYKRKLAYDKLSEIANSNNCFKKTTTAAMYQETSEIQSDSNLMSFLMFNQAKRDAISQDSRTTNYSNSVCAFGGINQLAQPNEFPPMSGHDLYLSEKPKKKGTRKKRKDFTSNSSLEAVYISPSKQGANHLVMKNDVTALEQKQGSEHIFAFDKIDSRRSELAALNLESNSISSSSGFSHRTATLDSHQFSSAVKTFTNSDLEVSEILETQKVNDLVRINSNRKPERRKTKGQGQLPNTDLAGSQGHVNIIFSSNVVSSTQKIPDSVVVRSGGERGNVFLPRIDSKCESDSSHLIPTCSNLMSITPNVENLLENIIEKIRHITISEIHKDARGIAETALVPFYGGGVIVPYKGLFDFAKKRQPRPKVDLDAETARVWNLLMGKGGNDSVDEDSEKEKRWDEERKVFHGRVESFIARMHLVQGDRRFSKWKGSVVDSVVGVFLTQNVSDHLSSSAFMALAARFPSKLRANNEESYQEKNEIHTEVQNNCIASLDDSGNLQEHISSKEVDHLGSQQNTGENESSNSNESFSCETRGNMSGYFVKCVGTHENAFGYESTQNSLCIPVRINGNTTEAEVENRLSFDDVASSSVVSSENSSGNQAKATNWTELNLQPDFQYEDFVTGSISNGLGFATSFVELLHMAERIPSKSFQDGVGCLEYSIPQKKTSTLDPWCNLGISTTSSGPCFNKYSLVDRLSENAVSLSDGSGMTNTNRDKLFDASNSPPLLTVNQNILQQNLPLVHENKFEDGSCAQNKHILQPESRSQTEACMTKQSFCRYNFQNDEKEASTSISVNQMCCQALDKDKFEIQQKDNTKFLPESTDIIQTDLRNLSDQQNFLNLGNKPKNLLEVFQGVESSLQNEACNSHRVLAETTKNVLEEKKVKAGKDRKETYDWDILRREVNKNGTRQERNLDTMDSLDWEAIRCADVKEIADAIKERGMNNRLAERIKDFLDRLVKDHGSIDLEWLREIEPDKAKDYLLSIRGLGLKSVECIRLLTLQHLAFPVDTNVGRICVRLGWVPLQPLPESLQLHLLELYPVQETVQKYLWPRLCKLDQRTLYELHYQLITFGKVFCTKNKPNCNSCPMRAECKHFASAFASARLALPGPEEKRLVSSAETGACEVYTSDFHRQQLPQIEDNQDSKERNCCNSCEPIIEEPSTPEIKQIDIEESTIEGIFYEDPDEIPTIKLDFEEFTQNLHNYMQEHNLEVKDGDMSKALVVLNPEAASIPMPKLKNVSLLRTEHHVYELPDSHPLLEGLDQREPDDPSSYLLAIWTPGETAQSVEPPEAFCNSQETGKLCDKTTCFACNSVRESEAQTVRGTILIPCRTAMKGRFPLNGTYFQVNEVFADHNTSCNPINVPREWIWNLPRRTVYFGTSIPTIFKGLTTQEIQQCFWRGFVCVRGFDRTTRAPKPLYARLHFPASKAAKNKKSPAAEARKTEARGGKTNLLIFETGLEKPAAASCVLSGPVSYRKLWQEHKEDQQMEVYELRIVMSCDNAADTVH